MKVTADHVAAVRALVAEDDDTFDQLTDNASPEWLDAFSRLVTATFFGGTKYRFGREASRENIIRFVARSRIRRGGDKAGFSPSLAEALMAAAVGIAPSPTGWDEIENATAQVALLTDLASEISFRDFELLLAGARSKVNKMVPQTDAEEGTAQRDSLPAETPAP
jgi:hypothetical protein